MYVQYIHIRQKKSLKSLLVDEADEKDPLTRLETDFDSVTYSSSMIVPSYSYSVLRVICHEHKQLALLSPKR